MKPEDVIKFEKMMANARDTWGANYQALLRVARAAEHYCDTELPEGNRMVWYVELEEAIKEVEHLLEVVK